MFSLSLEFNRSLLLLALIALVVSAVACDNAPPETVIVVVTATPKGDGGAPAPPPGEALITEDFNDEIADGWHTEGGAWGIQEREYDQAYKENNPVWSTYPDLDLNDYSAQADFKLVPEGYSGAHNRTASLAVRMTDTEHFYLAMLDWKEETLTLYKANGGANLTWLADRPYPLQEDTWHRLRVVARGPFLRVYVDDTLQLEVTDEAYPSGFVGLRTSGGHFRIDNVSVNTVSELAGSAPSLPFDDNFDDGDSDGWLKVNGEWRTINGALEQSATDGQVWAYQPNHGGINYRVKALVKPIKSTGSVGLSLRMNGPSNGYFGIIDHSAGEMQIIARISDQANVLASRPLPPDMPEEYTLTFEAAETNLRLMLGDGPALETNDDTFEEGFLGVWFKYAAATIDDVQAEEIAAPTPPAAELPFTDDFEDGLADGWYKVGGGWGIVDGTLDQGQYAPGTTASAWVDLEAHNYAMSARIRLVPEDYTDQHDRVIGLRIRNQGNKHAYVVSLNLKDGTAQFWYGDGQNWLKLSDPVPAAFSMEDWNTLRIEAYEEQLRFRLNGDLVLTTSDDRLGAGGFGFRIRDGHVQIDDVRAEEIDR